MAYSDGTEFVVNRPGTRVWAAWPDEATLEDTATYLLGPVLGFVLRLRGATCMHASAVAVENHAVLFLGPAGAGKSTTAAAFAQQGYRILSDDVAVLVGEGTAIAVWPGYPQLRLWPESAEWLYGCREALPRLTPPDGINAWWDKRYLDLLDHGYQFQREPLPLAAIYVLGEHAAGAEAPFVEPVSAPAALITLVANTYVNYLLDRQMRAREFEVLGRVAASVPLRRLIPHTDLASLSKLCEVVIQDVQTRPSPIRLPSGNEKCLAPTASPATAT